MSDIPWKDYARKGKGADYLPKLDASSGLPFVQYKPSRVDMLPTRETAHIANTSLAPQHEWRKIQGYGHDTQS